MARIRTIKPEFWTSEQIVECSTNARLLFVGLWNFADDGGVHPDSAARLKMEVYPGDSFSVGEIESMIDELISAQLLVRYSSQDKSYLAVTGWHKHQKIDRPNPKYPGPGDQNSTNARRTLDESSPPETETETETDLLTGKNGEDEKKRTAVRFGVFWTAYPKRNGKRKEKNVTFDKFKIKTEAEQEELLVAVRNYAKSQEAADGYAKDPKRFIEVERWKDWLIPETEAKPKVPVQPKKGEPIVF